MPPESVRMRQELHRLVIPCLQEQGFAGKYPRFYREYSPYRMDLIEFFPLRGGGGFAVGASVFFPKLSLREACNSYIPVAEIPPGDLSVTHTIIRHGIPGPFDGSFYYADVYESHFRLESGEDTFYYMAVGEKRADAYQPREGEVLVQKADADTCTRVAELVTEQLPALMDWFEQMQTPKDLKRWNKQNMKELQRKKSALRRWIEERFNHV